MCKKWHKLAGHLLWTNVAINNDNILLFLRLLTIARQDFGGLEQNRSILLNTLPSYTGPFIGLEAELGFLPLSDDWKLEEVSARRVFLLPPYPSTIEEAGMSLYANRISRGNVYLAVASVTLARLIRENLRELSTSSFRYTLWPDDLYIQVHPIMWEELFYPLHVVARFIESLPKTCSQVEISTSGGI
jgi:hypothetical protein